MKGRDLIAAATGALTATVLAGSVAWAAIPSPSGVIQGCYDSGGNVKVVEALPCPKGYTPFQWNQQGIQGPKGDTGAQGPKGDKGDQGDQGIQGPKGDQGDPGAPGIQGTKGDQGDPGAQGIQGLKGDKGDVGATGPQGLQGIQGLQGPTGPQGPKGDAGGLAGWELVSAFRTLPTGALSKASVGCPSGKTVVGGGGTMTGVFGNRGAYLSVPNFIDATGTYGWETWWEDYNQSGATYTVFVQAICVNE